MDINAANADINSTDTAKGVRESLIPSNVLDLLSETSYADDCFVNQRFSRKLQAFLAGYVNNSYSDFPISDS